MFTIEIGGKPIAVVDAVESDARELLEQSEFRDDLTSLTSGGKPLWDGRAALTMRPATPEERDVLGRRRAERNLHRAACSRKFARRAAVVRSANEEEL